MKYLVIEWFEIRNTRFDEIIRHIIVESRGWVDGLNDGFVGADISPGEVVSAEGLYENFASWDDEGGHEEQVCYAAGEVLGLSGCVFEVLDGLAGGDRAV